jgi:hypothetical protein
MLLEGEWVKDPKVTAHVLKEKMDALYEGMEEFQLNEQDIGRWLSRVYARVRKEKKGAGGGAGQEEEECPLICGWGTNRMTRRLLRLPWCCRSRDAGQRCGGASCR